MAVAAVWTTFLIPIWRADRDVRSLGAVRLDSPFPQLSDSETGLGPILRRVPARHGDGGNGLSHRDLVLVRRRCVIVTLGAASVATLAGWFVLNSLWMILIHLVVDAVFVWYVTMLRRIRTFREDLNALFAEHGDYVPPTREYPAIKVIPPRETYSREQAEPVLHQTRPQAQLDSKFTDREVATSAESAADRPGHTPPERCSGPAAGAFVKAG